MSCKKVLAQGFFVRKERYFLRLLKGHWHQKSMAKDRNGIDNRYWIYFQVPVSILLWEIHTFCARNMGVHIWRTNSECQDMRKQDKKLDSRAAKKGMKKLVSSDWQKILVLRTWHLWWEKLVRKHSLLSLIQLKLLIHLLLLSNRDDTKMLAIKKCLSMSISNAGDVMPLSPSQKEGNILNIVLHLLKTW